MDGNGHNLGKLEGQMELVLDELRQIREYHDRHEEKHEEIGTFMTRVKMVGSIAIVGWGLVSESLRDLIKKVV